MDRQAQETINRVKHGFSERFHGRASVVVHAPGRVNLIGEHTDYNEGFVLPCALPCGTVIAARPRTDGRVCVVALDYQGAEDSFESTLPIPKREGGGWANYIRAVVYVLLEAGHSVQGADLVIGGDVPQGAGLSSSASLQVGLALVFSTLSNMNLSPVQIALLAQRAENEYVGCHCGVMDQMASALGQEGQAVLLDCRDLSTQLVTIPEGVALLIVNSNVRRGLVDSAYNDRRRECFEAAQIMGVSALRDASIEQLLASKKQMSDQVFRRAHHVITEDERTQAAVKALARGELSHLGELMRASHRSLRDDFEVTVPPVDYAFELLSNVIGQEGGVRMTGGGFGGCLVAILPEDQLTDAVKVVENQYQLKTGLHPSIYLGKASKGARLL